MLYTHVTHGSVHCCITIVQHQNFLIKNKVTDDDGAGDVLKKHFILSEKKAKIKSLILNEQVSGSAGRKEAQMNIVTKLF